MDITSAHEPHHRRKTDAATAISLSSPPSPASTALSLFPGLEFESSSSSPVAAAGALGLAAASSSPSSPSSSSSPSCSPCSPSYINPIAFSASDEQLQEIVRQFINAQELPELQLELFGSATALPSNTNTAANAVSPSSSSSVPSSSLHTSLPSTLTLPSFLLPTAASNSPSASPLLSPSSPSSSSSRKRKFDNLDSFDIAFAIAASHLTDAGGDSAFPSSPSNLKPHSSFDIGAAPSSPSSAFASFTKSLKQRAFLPPPPPPLPLDVAAKRRKTNDVSASYKPTTVASDSPSSSSSSPGSSGASPASSASRQQRQNTTKMNHNRSERERRQRINDSIDELRDLLPPQCREIATNKLAILQESVGYMRHLKDSIERIQHERAAADEAYRNLYEEYRTLRHYLSVYDSYSDPTQLHVQHSVLPPFHSTQLPAISPAAAAAAAAAHHPHLSHHHHAAAGSASPSPGASPGILSPTSDPSILSVPSSSSHSS